MALSFVQGDTGPDITAIIHAAGNVNAPLDLTGATVRFQMRRPDDHRYQVNGAATVVDPVAGTVSYSWGANDLAQSGVFQAQWEITHPGGRIQTTDPEVRLTVRRQ